MKEHTKEFQCGSLSCVGVVNLSKSVARGFSAWNPCDGHLVTINLDYLPQI